MKRLTPRDRAQVTAILIQLIADLAGMEKAIDPEMHAVIQQVIQICCRSKLESLPDAGRALLAEAAGFVDHRDWMLTVLKKDNHMHLEARFGTDIRNARLAKSIRWVEARAN